MSPADRGLAKLTDRQWQIVELVSLGQTNPEIARAVGCSLATVKRDIAIALVQWDCRNRVALANEFRRRRKKGRRSSS